MSNDSRLELAIERIRRARRFTQSFVEDLTPADWYWSPVQFTTHIAWQAGHLAVAQYNLCLRRVRGRTPGDELLVADSFIEAFKMGSKPSADPAQGPPLSDIRRVFANVHEQSLAELAKRTVAELEAPVEQSHPAFKTKLDAVEFCSQHELVHAGQIAMLRRLMGKSPLR
jgi:hypothetical protein